MTCCSRCGRRTHDDGPSDGRGSRRGESRSGPFDGRGFNNGHMGQQQERQRRTQWRRQMDSSAARCEQWRGGRDSGREAARGLAREWGRRNGQGAQTWHRPHGRVNTIFFKTQTDRMRRPAAHASPCLPQERDPPPQAKRRRRTACPARRAQGRADHRGTLRVNPRASSLLSRRGERFLYGPPCGPERVADCQACSRSLSVQLGYEPYTPRHVRQPGGPLQA